MSLLLEQSRLFLQHPMVAWPLTVQDFDRHNWSVCMPCSRHASGLLVL